MSIRNYLRRFAAQDAAAASRAWRIGVAHGARGLYQPERWALTGITDDTIHVTRTCARAYERGWLYGDSLRR